VRSALALKLLVFAPRRDRGGPTTSLPESARRRAQLGLPLSRDSRFGFTIESLLQLGCDAEAGRSSGVHARDAADMP